MNGIVLINGGPCRTAGEMMEGVRRQFMPICQKCLQIVLMELLTQIIAYTHETDGGIVRAAGAV
jgi:hypothetical protein